MRTNTIKLFLILCLTAFSVVHVEAKRTVVPKMYMFGFAASFNDTIVHFTNIMEVDSVWIETKNNFLLGRNYYSHQFRSYLEKNMQMPDRTCITMYAKTRAKAEKKYLKLRRKYPQSKDGKAHFDVRYLDDGAFNFKTVNIREYEESEEEMEARNAALAKKNKKKGKKRE